MADMPRLFKATAEIAMASPDKVMLRLCTRFSEFGEVSGHGRCRRIETGFGAADVEDCGHCLRICAAGSDEVALAYVKLAMAEHLLKLADEPPAIVWRGDSMAGAPLPYFREMRVKRAVAVTPRMRRLTLAGDDLHRFASGGYHVRLLIPRRRGMASCWPVMGEDGRPLWPAGKDRPDARIYTLRRVDPAAGEVDIDFVLHDHDRTPGARFASEARPGDIVGMTGPGGGALPKADWVLLLGDETALPAISRILAELPAAATAVVRIEIAGEAERQPLSTAAQLDLRWLCRAAHGPGRLVDALGEIEWPEDGRSVFAWAGCEFEDFRAIRRHLRDDRGLKRDEHLAVAYWRRGFAGDDAREE
ncbi:MAG: siderophore-interacting protein [Rhizobiales bacterium]|nr:siderophore-interacting protein [Hyphomicrobiales bacterium]